MKYTFLIISVLFLVSSCDLIDIVDGCDEPEVMELTENDRRWLPDSIQYFIIQEDTFSVQTSYFPPAYEPEAVSDCKTPVFYRNSLITKDVVDIKMAIYTDITKEANYTNIMYRFSKSTPNSSVIGRSQVMGIIDLDRSLPVPMDNSYFVHSEYLGNHTIRGREFTEVYKFTDLDKNNVPEIDVFSITVSPIGFLRIEFYSGEVWERVIIE